MASHLSKVRNRRLAFKRQGGLCFWCGSQMLRQHESPVDHPLRVTAEHLVTKSNSGGNGANNIVAACNRCNTARKDHPLEIWLPRVKYRLKQAGNPQWFEVILSNLKDFAIDLPSATPAKAPIQQIADRPPPKA